MDEIIHKRYFPTKTDGVALEAGALDGVWDSSCYFFEQMGWTVFNVEPLPNMYAKLTRNRPRSVNINVALSSECATALLRNYKHPRLGYEWGNASLAHTEKHRMQLEAQCGRYAFEEVEVQTNTYAHLVQELGITQLDLFVLDVEGHEPSVIDGMKGCSVLPEVFVIEHGHRDPQYFVEKLTELDAHYVLDYTYKVNSYFVKQV